MGLDMYAYVAAREGQQDEYWESAEFDQETQSHINATVSKPIEIAYWRKHPNLHGWFEQLWERKGRPGGDDETSFNGIELELTREDIDDLEEAIELGRLPATTGFFFGDESDSYYYEQDVQFLTEARAQLFLGLKVFYNSSW